MATLNDTMAGWQLVADYSAIPMMGYKIYRTPDGQEKIVQGDFVGGDGEAGAGSRQSTGTSVYDRGFTLGQSMRDTFDTGGNSTGSYLMKDAGNTDLGLFLAAVGGMQFLPGGAFGGAGGGAAGATTGAAGGGAGGAGAEGVNLGTATGADLGTFYGGTDAAATLGGGAAAGGAGAVGAAGAGGNALSFLPSGTGSLLAPAASLASGYLSSKAAGDAADTQSQAARDAAALQEPFRQGGVSALNRELDLLGLSGNTGADGYGSLAKDFGMADFQADPGRQFRLDEGQRALEASAAARGNLLSGKTIKDTLDYSQGLASQEYGNAYNRFQTNRAAKLQPLQSLRGMGMSSANTIGDYTLQGGNAQAAGTVGSANAYGNALSQGLNYIQSQDMLDYLRKRADSPVYVGYPRSN